MLKAITDSKWYWYIPVVGLYWINDLKKFLKEVPFFSAEWHSRQNLIYFWAFYHVICFTAMLGYFKILG